MALLEANSINITGEKSIKKQMQMQDKDLNLDKIQPKYHPSIQKILIIMKFKLVNKYYHHSRTYTSTKGQREKQVKTVLGQSQQNTCKCWLMKKQMES